jgi:hypothetical protein
MFMSLVEKHAGFIMVARIPRMLRSLLQLALHSCEHKAKELLKHQEWGGKAVARRTCGRFPTREVPQKGWFTVIYNGK